MAGLIPRRGVQKDRPQEVEAKEKAQEKIHETEPHKEQKSLHTKELIRRSLLIYDTLAGTLLVTIVGTIAVVVTTVIYYKIDLYRDAKKREKRRREWDRRIEERMKYR
jgi:hypothetical protein